MAQTGYTPISFYYSSTSSNIPSAGNLVAGEIAINTADGVIYYKNAGGSVVPLSFGSTGISWQAVQTANFTAAAGNGYPVNTTSGAITVTLPASPTAGQLVTFTDYAGTFATNNLTINPNGNKLLASTDSVLMATNNESLSFVYIDSTQGWLPYDGYNSSIPASALYLLQKSLRFRASNTAYLNRTPSVASNRQIYTISAWVKRGLVATGAFYNIYAAGTGSGNNDGLFFDNVGGALYFTLTANTDSLITSGVFIDPAAWYHIVCAVDTTQATASNRIKIYVNGVQQSLVTNTGSGYPAQNTNSTYINTTNQQRIGAHTNAGYYFDGYMAEYNFIDGQALTPSSFGQTDPSTGSWIPIQYVGTYGTNGFYLKFTNTTSTTTLGNDFSGNGNNFTVNNVSLTAGATYDSMTDVPTLTSATVANYPVWNPLYTNPSFAKPGYLNGNLAITPNSVTSYTQATMAFPMTGKYYYESQYLSGGLNTAGIATTTNGFATLYVSNGQIYVLGVLQGSTVAAWSTNDIIGVALDQDNHLISFYKNNTLMGTYASYAGESMFAASYIDASGGTGTQTINFGQQPFVYTPPTGYVALNTYNL